MMTMVVGVVLGHFGNDKQEDYLARDLQPNSRVAEEDLPPFERETGLGDEVALTVAGELVARGGARSVVIACGGPATRDLLRRSLPGRQQRAIHVQGPEAIHRDVVSLTKALAFGVKAAEANLVLVGEQRRDFGLYLLPTLLSEELAWPLRSVSQKIETNLEQVAVTIDDAIADPHDGMPTVLSLGQGLLKPGYKTLREMLEARSKEIQQIEWSPGTSNPCHELSRSEYLPFVTD